jgi:uncharacterized membrane protein YsdA (DUF1294 family)/cold shock CspA family protein
MRTKGKLHTWNDEKGFGFITPGDGGKDVFLHISAFRNRARRPEVGHFVTFALSTDDRGRPRATKATLPGDRLTKPKKKTGAAGAVIIPGTFLVVLAFSVLSHKIPPLILWVYLALSVITFLVYAFDKSAAKDGAWRTPESTLHWLSIAGGWPGALIAQQLLRHKSKKQSFRTVFWFTVVINCGALAWVYTPAGAESIKSWMSSGEKLFSFGQKAAIEWSE